MADSNTVSDINLVARFLAHEQVSDLSSCPPVDCIVFCAFAVLHGAEIVFRVLQRRPDLTKTLILCGGIGHSTQLIYDAVAGHPTYRPLAKEVTGLPEALVLQKVMQHYFDVSAMTSAGCTILIEDKSTNCGANAIETRKVFAKSGVPIPETIIVVQDPTMALRTVASFEKAYDNLDTPPSILSCPTFVPQMQSLDGELQFAITDVPAAGLWDTKRFLNLIMGEIPRLRDDATGYGPRGKGFISHVDIPAEVEEAWRRLQGALDNSR